jgi:hypothetical protein
MGVMKRLFSHFSDGAWRHAIVLDTTKRQGVIALIGVEDLIEPDATSGTCSWRVEATICVSTWSK